LNHKDGEILSTYEARVEGIYILLDSVESLTATRVSYETRKSVKSRVQQSQNLMAMMKLESQINPKIAI
jgi:hypothetical protein